MDEMCDTNELVQPKRDNATSPMPAPLSLSQSTSPPPTPFYRTLATSPPPQPLNEDAGVQTILEILEAEVQTEQLKTESVAVQVVHFFSLPITVDSMNGCIAICERVFLSALVAWRASSIDDFCCFCVSVVLRSICTFACALVFYSYAKVLPFLYCFLFPSPIPKQTHALIYTHNHIYAHTHTYTHMHARTYFFLAYSHQKCYVHSCLALSNRFACYSSTCPHR